MNGRSILEDVMIRRTGWPLLFPQPTGIAERVAKLDERIAPAGHPPRGTWNLEQYGAPKTEKSLRSIHSG